MLEPAAALQPELQFGERVLWTATPNPWRAFLGKLGVLLFGIPWTAFALFWETLALSIWSAPLAPGANAAVVMVLGVVFPLFGLIFVLIGCGMLAAPFFAAYAARRTLYVITTERALIVTQNRRRTIQAFPLASIPQPVEREERSDGSGHLLFHPTTRLDGDGNLQREKIGFSNLAQVREAEAQLVSAIARHRL